MKTTLLFTIACIFLSFQVSSTIPAGKEMQRENQFANGKVLTVKVQSQSIANNMLGDSEFRRVSVYLPPGYDQNSDRNYPVIYMLSDMNGTNEDWFHISGNQLLAEIIDNTIRSGKIKPMIMVFPDGKNKFGGCWYTNSSVSGNWEDFVVTDLVNYIDQNFRTLPFAMSRGIAGKGMGGYGALKLATKNPGIFSTVYSLNALVDFETLISQPYLWDNSFKTAALATGYPTNDELADKLLGMAVAFAPDKDKTGMLGNLPKTETGEIIQDVFEKWMANDLLKMIPQFSNNLNLLKAITVDCSTADAKVMLNSNYSDALKSNGIKHTISYFEGNVDLLSRVTEVLLPLFSENLCNSLLEFNASTCYTYTDVLKTTLKTDGTIFIVPNKTDNNLKSIQENNVIKLDVKANQENKIPFAGLNKGIYKIYGVSSTGFVDKSHTFGLNGGEPEVIIQIIDSKTGEKIDACGLKVNDKECGIDEKGEYCFKGSGETILCSQAENYNKIEKSVMIYTDTSFVLSLVHTVHDSYLQVVDKNYGAPVFEAMVTQNNMASLTGRNGFTTIQNLYDGMLECRIFKAGYFAEEVKMPLQPGATAVIALTPKKANVMFVLSGTEGHLQDGTIKLGNLTLKPDEFGVADFKELDTRVEYTFTIENASYEKVQGSIFLEANTVLPFYLEPRQTNNASLKNEQLSTGINEQMAREILIYPNPATDAVTIQTKENKGLTVELSTINGTLIYKSKIEGTLHQINLSNLSNGVYFVTVKSDNYYHTRKIMKL
jgi:S-formylglutathione hydrolase FrmB